MTIVRRAAPSAVAAFGPPHERSCTPGGIKFPIREETWGRYPCFLLNLAWGGNLGTLPMFSLESGVGRGVE
jgi:hypothetical protein